MNLLSVTHLSILWTALMFSSRYVPEMVAYLMCKAPPDYSLDTIRL